ncbi:MAG: glycosyltransferase family 4 protein [Deltaproteobacteria bacterium]|nr:glycosyltransferase family 4 protein [Deltaproteobacteria bacterium]
MGTILILIQGKKVAASRYRILQYIPYLEQYGNCCDVFEFPRSVMEYLSLFRILPRYDCVFVQRKRFHVPFLWIFRQRARRIVYDLDDAVMYRNSLSRSPYSKTRLRRFINMVRRCDAVIAGNTFLADQTRSYNGNVKVIPTSIPASRYSLKDYSTAKNRVTIGWIGDHGSIHYLEKMRDVFEEIGKRFSGGVELKIICDVFFDCTHIPVKKVQWSSETEVEELKDIDIGVMPLLDDLWSWGKCGLKILQYYGVGLPVVCTPVGVNKDIVSHGDNGFWAMTGDEWIQYLSTLIEDAGLRKRMGLKGRSVLDQGFTREVNSPRLLDTIKG